MDVNEFKEMRWFRVVSHNGNSASLTGVPSASNFTVVVFDDMSKVGDIGAFSLENVTFPNLFPNISSRNGNNRFYVRFSLPISDGLTLVPGEVYTFSASDHIGRAVAIAGPYFGNDTVGWVEWFNSQPEVSQFLSFRADEYGGIFISSVNGLPVILTSYTWSTTLGVEYSQIGAPFTSIVAYPPSVVFPVSVPAGFYDQDQIATMLTVSLNAIPGETGGFLVSVAPVGYNKLFRVSNSDHDFMMFPSAATGTESTNYRQLAYQMGFLEFPSSLYPSIQAPLNPSLQGEQVVYLHSSAFASAKKSFPGEGPPDSLIATIPIWGGYGDVIGYSLNQWASPAMVYTSPVTPRQFDFTLRNQYNEDLDIGWNQSLTMTFRVFFR